jgi:nucleoid-associated protein YgaU
MNNETAEWRVYKEKKKVSVIDVMMVVFLLITFLTLVLGHFHYQNKINGGLNVASAAEVESRYFEVVTIVEPTGDIPTMDEHPLVEDTLVAGVSLEEPQEEETYTVQAGDNLWDIATELYGDGAQWTKLVEANADTIGPDHVINVGQVLNI